MDNLLVIVLKKNHVFNYRSKYIDTKFYYLQDYIMNKKVEIEEVKTQNQAADIFIKPLKYYVFFFFYQDERCVESYEEIKFKRMLRVN